MDFALGSWGARFVCAERTACAAREGSAAFMLDTHTAEFGYQETLPYLVNSTAMTGTGQLQNLAKTCFVQTTSGSFRRLRR